MSGSWGRPGPCFTSTGRRSVKVLRGTGADFRGVHGTGSAVWAVGVNDDGTGEIRRHRDGRWLPELVPAITAHINDVWASSDLDAWAVGWAGDRGIALRSNGSSWAEFQLPNGVTALKGVWGSGPDDVWMVGDNVVLHFNGQTMEPAGPSVIGGLRSVWGVGPDRLWAVGDGQVLSYSEGTWTDITSDVPLGPSGVPDYRAVSGVGDADVWIASNDGMLALFDGVSWTSVERETSWDVNGVWGTRDVVWALSGASGGVLVGADPVRVPHADRRGRAHLPGLADGWRIRDGPRNWIPDWTRCHAYPHCPRRSHHSRWPALDPYGGLPTKGGPRDRTARPAAP